MASGSGGSIFSGRLRKLRRVWSSDEEEEDDKPPKAVTTSTQDDGSIETRDGLQMSQNSAATSVSRSMPSSGLSASASSRAPDRQSVQERAADINRAEGDYSYRWRNDEPREQVNETVADSLQNYRIRLRVANSGLASQDAMIVNTKPIQREDASAFSYSRYTSHPLAQNRRQGGSEVQTPYSTAFSSRQHSPAPSPSRIYLPRSRSPKSPLSPRSESFEPQVGRRAEARRTLYDSASEVSSFGLSAGQFMSAQADLVFQLQQSMHEKLGFISSIFHNWRTEALLSQCERFSQNRAAEWDRKHAMTEASRRAQCEMLVGKWMLGDEKGLLASTWREWVKAVKEAKLHVQAKERIHMVTAQWLMGNTKGLMSTTFNAWCEELVEARKHAARLAHEDELAERDAQLAAAFAQIDAKNASAKKDIFVVLAKWEKGADRGTLMAIMQSWRQAVTDSKAKEKKNTVFKEMMLQWCKGETEGLLRSSFSSWSTYTNHIRHSNEERARADAEKDAQDARAKESVALMIKKWLLGNEKGLKTEVWQSWHKYARTQALLHNSKSATTMAVERFLLGDRKGLLMTTFLNWKAEYEKALQGSLHKDSIEELERLLEEERKRYADLLELHSRKIAKGHSVVDKAVGAWTQGTGKSYLKNVFISWRSAAQALYRHRKAQNLFDGAMYKWIEGDKKGLMHMVLQPWKKCTEIANHERQQQLFDKYFDDKKNEWHQTAEQAKREASHKSVEQVVQKWIRGDENGLKAEVFSSWSEFMQKEKEREKQHEASKSVILRWLQGETRGAMTLALQHWTKFVHIQAGERKDDQAKEMMLMQQSKSKIHLMKYFTQLMGGAGDPAFMSALVAQWHRVSMGEKSKELQRQLEMQLQHQQHEREMRTAANKQKQMNVLSNLGFKSAKGDKLKYFLAWLGVHQKARDEMEKGIARNAAVNKLGAFMIGQNSKDILQKVLREWNSICHDGKHTIHAERLEMELANQHHQIIRLQEQLNTIMDTLQKELRTKEELTEELRQALQANMRQREDMNQVLESTLRSSKTHRRLIDRSPGKDSQREDLGDSMCSRKSAPDGSSALTASMSLPNTPLRGHLIREQIQSTNRSYDDRDAESDRCGGERSRSLPGQRRIPSDGTASRSLRASEFDEGWDAIRLRLRQRGVRAGGPRL